VSSTLLEGIGLGRVTEACQALADLVRGRRIIHPDDPLLNEHKAGAARFPSGDGWRFIRRGGHGHVDAPTPPPGRSWSR
jgi:hypothetical protein